MTDLAGTHAVEIAAWRERCLEILLDVERYPAWYDTLDSVEVTKRDSLERPAVMRVSAGAGRLGAVRFDLRYRYDLPRRIDASQVGGDGRVVGVQSAWILESRGSTTRVTYEFSADAGGRAVKLVLRAARALVERDLIAGFAEALKREAERRSPS